MTSLSRKLFNETAFVSLKNCSSLKMDRILKASSVVMSSLPCCPKLWKTRNHLSKTPTVMDQRMIYSKPKIICKFFILNSYEFFKRSKQEIRTRRIRNFESSSVPPPSR